MMKYRSCYSYSTGILCIYLCICLLATIVQTEDFFRSEKNCEEVEGIQRRSGSIQCPRNERVNLVRLEEDQQHGDNENVFFIESSDRPYLNPRQICSVESAIRNSGKNNNNCLPLKP